MTCDACHREAECQRDRRIAGAVGGTYDPRNTHWLCRVCHQRKTELERLMMAGGLNDGRRGPTIHAEWFDLAYPEPTPIAALDYAAAWCLTE